MRELGYPVSVQALVFDKEYGSFDVLSGKNAQGKEVSLYFDINSFLAAENPSHVRIRNNKRVEDFAPPNKSMDVSAKQ